MIHELPAPVRGATHVDIVEAAVNVRSKFCILRVVVGTATVGGDALRADAPQWDHRVTLQDEGYLNFAATAPNTAALTIGALVQWIDTHALWET